MFKKTAALISRTTPQLNIQVLDTVRQNEKSPETDTITPNYRLLEDSGLYTNPVWFYGLILRIYNKRLIQCHGFQKHSTVIP